MSNVELLGSKKKWVNNLLFWVGVLIFDIIVSVTVAINIDKIEALSRGEDPKLKIWQVVTMGEFWLIFVFGMLPLIIIHYLISYVSSAYQKSQRDLVDAEKVRKIHVLDEEMIELNAEKEAINNRIRVIDDAIRSHNEKTQALETEFNNQKKQIDSKYAGLLNQINDIFENYKAKIISGRIFTDEIFKSVTLAYTSGFIEYLPKYYSPVEVTSRVREIEQIINNQAIN